MTAIFIVIFTVIGIWTGLLSSWSVAYATGLAQLGIWTTLQSLVPFVSLWVSLKGGVFSEISQSTMRTSWNCSQKASTTKKINIEKPRLYFYFSKYSFFSFFYIASVAELVDAKASKAFHFFSGVGSNPIARKSF